MRHLLLISTLALVGCAHGIPTGMDDVTSQAQDEANSRKDAASAKLDEQTADIQDQAKSKTAEAQAKSADLQSQINGKTADLQNQVNSKVDAAKNQALGMVGNATMSKAIAPEILRRMPLISDSKTLLYANTVGQYVAQGLVPSLRCQSDGASASDVRVAIVKSTTPSSFSLPGGYIFVTTALVQKMSTEDELAGVIANEIVTSVCEKGVPGNLAAQAASGWSDFVMQVPTKSLSRTDLAFADKYALVTLYRRGYDVEPYVKFVSKNETSGRHMWGSDRAAALNKSIAATPKIASTAEARASRFQAAKAKSI
jgi:predicted Zn-dependent protease